MKLLGREPTKLFSLSGLGVFAAGREGLGEGGSDNGVGGGKGMSNSMTLRIAFNQLEKNKDA